MEAEIATLEKNNTWTAVNKPDKVPIIDCKWVYKVKRDQNDKVKFKARLVARGFTQSYGENYWETYAPVVKNSTVRLLMAIAVENNYEIGQIDVRSAYTNSVLNEEIYMSQPEGFNSGDGKVLKLNKSLYGLKQSGHEWNKCINDYIVNGLSFNRLKSDPCVYEKGSTVADKVIIIIYVDDMLIMSACKSKIEKTKAQISRRFDIDDIGEATKYLGLEIKRSTSGMILHQTAFTNELLREYNMDQCNSVKTPLDPGMKLLNCEKETCSDKCEELIDSTSYRRIIGKLLYLAGSTRPDIMFAISNLSRFNTRPHSMHMQCVKHVLRYLKGTLNYGLSFKKTGESLYGYADADWASCIIDRRSYTGYVFILGGCPISWESRKQQTVALSSTEAEYMALCSASKEALFLHKVLNELKEDRLCVAPLKLYCDNRGAICISNNVGYNARTKHIDLKHYFIKDLVTNKEIQLEHVRTQEMLADIFTKPLNFVKHDINMKAIINEITN